MSEIIEHVPAIFEIVGCKNANHNAESEPEIVPGEILVYSDHVREAINALLQVFQEIKNGEIANSLDLYFLGSKAEAEDLKEILLEENNQLEEEFDDAYSVALGGYDGLINGAIPTDYSNLSEEEYLIVKAAEKLLGQEDEEIDETEIYNDFRLKDIQFSSSVKELIQRLHDESNEKIFYNLIFQNFINRNIVHHIDKKVGKGREWFLEKAIVFAPSPSLKLKNRPDIVVKYLFKEEKRKGFSLQQGCFGVKVYQSQQTFEAVNEILEGKVKI